MSPMFTVDAIIAELSPVAGHTAPNTYAQSYSICLAAVGRVPRFAQPCVNTPCCPNLISSWNQTSKMVAGFCRRNCSIKGGCPS